MSSFDVKRDLFFILVYCLRSLSLMNKNIIKLC